ncbi:MAG: hypothetical protein ACE5I1_07805 [bacterium]
MDNAIYTFAFSFFAMAACCYLLFIISDPLEELGGRIGKLLRLPEDVVASTFQALATSGPEIVLAILAATTFIAHGWENLILDEKAASGTLNMAFSAMDNLLGIGAIAIIFMIRMKKVNPKETIPAKPSTIIGLAYYTLASGALAYFIWDARLTESEAWVLMGLGILFIISQFFLPASIERLWPTELGNNNNHNKPAPLQAHPSWSGELIKSGFLYAFLVYALVIFVMEALSATFDMAGVTKGMSIISLGGIILLFTSYVSSFPEFVMAYRYSVSDKRSALLGMLFGSNVIDLAFAGFRAIWRSEEMIVVTTGLYSELLPWYICALPVVALLFLFGLATKLMKWSHAYAMIAFYVLYIASGFILL